MIKVRNITFAILITLSSTVLHAQRSVEILPDVETLYICTDSSFQLNATEALSYSWSPANIFDDPSSRTPIVTPTGPTLVILEAVVNGIIRRDSVFVQPTAPTVSLSSDQDEDVCASTTVTVSANNNVENQGISWEYPEELYVVDSLSNRIIIQPLRTTQIIATINVTGCEVKDTFIVGVKPPLVTIENEDTVFVCKGSDITLAASTSSGFSNNLVWSPNINISDTTSVNGEVVVTPTTESIMYYATYTEDGCTIVDSVLVQVDSLPENFSEITLTEDKEVYCEGDTVIMESPIFNTGRFPSIKHKWSATLVWPEEGQDPLGTWGFETPDSLYNLIITAQDSATYQRITVNGACIDTAMIDIPVIPQKEITILPDPAIVCPNEPITLTAEFEGKGEITWEPEEFINGPENQKSVNIGPLSENTEVKITVEEEGCPSEQTIMVQVVPPLLSLNTETVICEGQSIQLNFNPLDGTTYQWSSPDDGNFNSTDPTVRVSPNTTTRYEVTAQFGDCPEETSSLTVNVIPPATVNVNPASLTICPNEEFTLIADGNAPSFAVESYEWQFGGSSQSGDDITIRTLREDAIFTMVYRVLTPNGQECSNATAQSVIEVEEQPEILGFEVNPDSATTSGIFLGESVGVLADILGSTQDYIFQWMANEDIIDGMGINITDTPGEDTQYKLTLISPNGCETSEPSPVVTVIVPRYEIPNVFTPNGDNVNDFFNIAYVGIRDITAFVQEFQVFNRWGQLVYDNDTPATGWDGNVNGNPAPSDVYVYKIVVQFPDGTTEENSGEVTLIR